MSLDLKPSSDWDGWTPPDSSTMQMKFPNIDLISDIPTIRSDPDPADLMSAIAEADRQQQPERRKGKRRQALSTASLVAGPTSRRKRKRKAVKDDMDALSTIATVDGPVVPRKTINRRKRRRILNSNSKKIPLSAARKMIKASKGGMVGQQSHSTQPHLQDHVGQSSPRTIVKALEKISVPRKNLFYFSSLKVVD